MVRRLIVDAEPGNLRISASLRHHPQRRLLALPTATRGLPTPEGFSQTNSVDQDHTLTARRDG